MPLPDPNPSQQPVGGAAGTGGRTGIREQGRMPSGGEGEIGRGSPVESAVGQPEAEPFRSRMDRIGAGAEGTGGRTYPDQQPTTVSAPRARGESGVGPATRPSGREEGGEGAEGELGRDLKPKRHKGSIAFGEGLEFTSDDDEFRLQFHNLTQAEYRGFDNRDLGPGPANLHDQFFLPRVRWYFVGDLTKKVGFYTVINRGYGSLDLLDAFISLRFDDRVRFRIGRMKTPYLYEYFSIAEGDLIAPERSIFAGNMALNRQDGFMFFGELFDARMSYATGLYNGPRRSFQDLNGAKDFIGNVTFRPWLTSQRFTALNYLNIGASWDVGYQNNNPPQPIFFDTASDQTTSEPAESLSPTFLKLNNNAIELGNRVQWGAHVVWYYRSFFLLAEYGGARAGYGLATGNSSTPVNFDGWNVTASYFLTGEQVTRRVNMVQPRREFNFNFLKAGEQFSPGAVEVFARYDAMDIGRNIFTGGFADPNLWTNHVWATDVGLNWYLNFYTRIYLDWQHAEYGNPINVAPGKFTSFTDLYWLRFQVFF
jgi:phosphate-selective porin OprO/OprP